MPELINLERLNEHVRSAVSDYVGQLLELHGGNILAVAVYGSAARGDFTPKRSDVNLAVLVRNLDLETLSKSLKLVARGIRRRIVPPLFLTSEYISSSLDVFPLEFQDMRDSHVIVFGEDFLADVEVDVADLRRECEQQVKGHMLRLRQAYLELGRSAKGIELLLHKSLNSLIPVLRGMLTVKGNAAPAAKEETINAAAKEFGIDAAPFLAVLKDKAGDEKIQGKEAGQVLEEVLAQVRRLAKTVDAL
jgi:predicted nucleotidyltransferase